MRKLLVLLALLSLLMASGSAHALTWAWNMQDIYDNGGLDVVVPGPEYSTVSSLADPFGGTISFNQAQEIRTIGSGWVDWNTGYSGNVLTTWGNYLRISFSEPVYAWGMYIQPNVYGVVDVSITLSDGDQVSWPIDATSGMPANFVGFYDGNIDYIDIEMEQITDAIAIGNIAMTRENPVPEPATLVLMGLGLASAGIVRRFHRK